MTEIVERLKVAAQEAHRVNQVPASKDSTYPVRVLLTLEDPRGVRVRGNRGPSLTHDVIVPWSEIEQARLNVVVAQIGKTVEILSC